MSQARRRAVIAAAIALAAAWPGTGAQVELELPAGAIVWSPARRLQWEDFRAKAPGRLDGARSLLGYGYAVGCRDGVLRARVLAYFVPDGSWVAHRIQSSGLASRLGIKHEQTHFDLKEVFARRARKRLADLNDPCARSDDALNALVEEEFKAEKAEQTRYDVRTASGEAIDKQDEWNRRVASDLLVLKDFADPPPIRIRN